MSGHFTGNPYKWEGTGPNGPHVTRYFLAKGWIMPGETVLDAACCTGYGSQLLSKSAKKVIGLEVDEGAIDDAKNLNQEDNIEYNVADLNSCELPDVDVAISIETIEHLTPEGMVHFVDQLKKHVKRMIFVCVPLGGTSFAYVNEPPGPATEKNDFMKLGDVEKLVQDDDWKVFNSWEYGYSGMVVFYKKSPER